MMAECIYKEKIEDTVKKIADRVDPLTIKEKWKSYSESHLINELVACILGSRARFEVASMCLQRLKDKDLLNKNSILRNPNNIQMKIQKTLEKNGYLFSKSKADYIICTIINIFQHEKLTMKKILANCNSDFEARDRIVKLCKGIGPKQASLFLRNIHYSENLAILDSHVMKFMKIQGIEKDIKKAINKTDYIKYETSLQIYANGLRKSMAQLDVAIWIVMRVAQRDMKWL